MKKLKIALAILVIAVLAIVVYMQLNKGKSTIKGPQSDFAIKDTAAITKIFMADRNGNEILLKRQNGFWKVNDKYTARPDLINILLETIYKMRVKAPVSKSLYDKVVRDLAATGVKVEIYKNNESKPAKVIYVGTANQSHTGTYMIIEGSSLPYLVHIEGFHGFLTPRFAVYENDWRVKKVFNTPPKLIKRIQVEHIANQKESFVIERTANGGFELKNMLGVPVTGWDTIELFDYINLFSDVNFEGWEHTKPFEYIDSVRKSEPLEIYTVETTLGKTTSIKTYIKPLPGGEDLEGNRTDIDIDRMYGLINDKEFVVIQYYTFDPLNRKLSDFTNSGN